MSASNVTLLGLTVDLSVFSTLPLHLHPIISATCLIICYALTLVTWTEALNFVDRHMQVLVWSARSLEPEVGPDGAAPDGDRDAQNEVDNRFPSVCASLSL